MVIKLFSKKNNKIKYRIINVSLNKISIFVFIFISQNILGMWPGNLTWKQYMEKREKDRVDKIILKKKIDYLIEHKKNLNEYSKFEIVLSFSDIGYNGFTQEHRFKSKEFISEGNPLQQAMFFKDFVLIESVLKAGADVNQLFSTGIGHRKESAMHYVASKGYFDLMPLLIKFGALIDIEDSNGDTPLHLAARGTEFNGLDTLEFLIKKGAKLNCMNKGGLTPLMVAAENLGEKHGDKFAVMKLLLFNGANPNKIDFKGRDVIDCFKKYDDSVEFTKILEDYKKQIKDKLLENSSMSNDPVNIVADYLVAV